MRERLYTTEETVAIVLDSDADPEPTGQESASDMDTDNDTADEEYMPVPSSSAASSTESADSRERETLDVSWRSKNGEIVWAPTNSARLPYNLSGTGLTPGPACYDMARVDEIIDSSDLFFTSDIMVIITNYTNLHGRRTV